MKRLGKEVSILASIKENIVILSIIVIGSFLRVWNYWDWSLTNDELSALNRLNFDHLSDLIRLGVKVDGHPAFVQVLLFYWTKLWGVSEFSLRFLFVIAGIGSIIFFYKLANKWLGNQRALLSTALFSASQLFILYAQIARPYSMGTFFVLAFSFYWTCFIKEQKSSRKQLFFFVLFGVLALLTHYFAGLTVAVLMFFGLFTLKKNRIIYYICSCAAIGILFLPHLPITLHHIAIGGVGWIPEPEWNFLYKFLYELFNSKFLFLFTTLLILIIGLLNKGTKVLKKKSLFFFALFFVPYLISYFYSIHVSPLLQFSVLLFFTPFLFIGIVSILPSNLPTKLFYPLLFLIFGLLLSQYSFLSRKPFANYKAVIQKSIELEEEFAGENILSIGNFTDSSYAQYYIDQIAPTYQFDYLNLNSQKPSALIQALGNNKAKYVMVSFANQPLSHHLHELIKYYYPSIIKKIRLFNSEVILYSNQLNKREKSFLINTEVPNKKWNINVKLRQDSIYLSPSTAYNILPTIPYALTYKDSIYNVFKGNNFLTISCSFKSEEPTAISIVTVVKRNGETLFWNALPLNESWLKNEWSFACSVLEKTNSYQPKDEVYVYLWNPKGESTFIDDFKIANYYDSDYNYYEF